MKWNKLNEKRHIFFKEKSIKRLKKIFEKKKYSCNDFKNRHFVVVVRRWKLIHHRTTIKNFLYRYIRMYSWDEKGNILIYSVVPISFSSMVFVYVKMYFNVWQRVDTNTWNDSTLLFILKMDYIYYFKPYSIT